MRVLPLSSLNAGRDVPFSAPQMLHQMEPDTARTQLLDSARTQLLDSARTQLMDPAPAQLPNPEWAQPLFRFDITNFIRKEHAEMRACSTDTLSNSARISETCRERQEATNVNDVLSNSARDFDLRSCSQGATMVADPLSKFASHIDMRRCSQGVIHVRDPLSNSARSSDICGHSQEAMSVKDVLSHSMGHLEIRACSQAETNVTDPLSKSASHVDMLRCSQGIINVEDPLSDLSKNLEMRRCGEEVTNIKDAFSNSARHIEIQSCSQGETSVTYPVVKASQEITDVKDPLSNSRHSQKDGYDQEATNVRALFSISARHLCTQGAINIDEPSFIPARDVEMRECSQKATDIEVGLPKSATHLGVHRYMHGATTVTDPLSKSTSHLEIRRYSQGVTNVKDNLSNSARHFDMRRCRQDAYNIEDALSKSAGHVEAQRYSQGATNFSEPLPKSLRVLEVRRCSRGVSNVKRHVSNSPRHLSNSAAHIDIRRCSQGATSVTTALLNSARHVASAECSQQTSNTIDYLSNSARHVEADGCSQGITNMKDPSCAKHLHSAPQQLIETDIENSFLKERLEILLLKQGATNVKHHPRCSSHLHIVEQENILLKSLLKSKAGLLTAFTPWSSTLQFLKSELELCRERQNELRQDHEDRMRGLQIILQLEHAQSAMVQADEQAGTVAELSEAESELRWARIMQKELQQELRELQSARSSYAMSASQLTSEIEELRLQLQALIATRRQQRECSLKIDQICGDLDQVRHLHHNHLVEGEAEIDKLQRDLNALRAEVQRGTLDTMQEHCKVLHLAHQQVCMTPELLDGLRAEIKQRQLELESSTALEEAKEHSVQELGAEITTSRQENLRQLSPIFEVVDADNVLHNIPTNELNSKSAVKPHMASAVHTNHKSTKEESVVPQNTGAVSEGKADETWRTNEQNAKGKLLIANAAAKVAGEEPCNVTKVDKASFLVAGAAAEVVDQNYVVANLKDPSKQSDGVCVISTRQDAESRLVDRSDDLQCCHPDTMSELSTMVLSPSSVCTDEAQISPLPVLEPFPMFEEEGGKNDDVRQNYLSSLDVEVQRKLFEAERIVTPCTQAAAKVTKDEHIIMKKNREEERSDANAAKASRSCTGLAANSSIMASTPRSPPLHAAPPPLSSHCTLPVSIHSKRTSLNGKPRDGSSPTATSHRRPALSLRLGASPRRHSLSPRTVAPAHRKVAPISSLVASCHCSEVAMKSSKDKAPSAAEFVAKSTNQDRVVAEVATETKQPCTLGQKNAREERLALELAVKAAEGCATLEQKEKLLAESVARMAEEQRIAVKKKAEEAHKHAAAYHQWRGLLQSLRAVDKSMGVETLSPGSAEKVQGEHMFASEKEVEEVEQKRLVAKVADVEQPCVVVAKLREEQTWSADVPGTAKEERMALQAKDWLVAEAAAKAAEDARISVKKKLEEAHKHAASYQKWKSLLRVQEERMTAKKRAQGRLAVASQAAQELIAFDKKAGKERSGMEDAVKEFAERSAINTKNQEESKAAETLEKAEDEGCTATNSRVAERAAEVATEAEVAIKAAEDRMTAVEKAWVEMPALVAAAKAASQELFPARNNAMDAAMPMHRRPRRRTFMPVLQQRQVGK